MRPSWQSVQYEGSGVASSSLPYAYSVAHGQEWPSNPSLGQGVELPAGYGYMAYQQPGYAYAVQPPQIWPGFYAAPQPHQAYCHAGLPQMQLPLHFMQHGYAVQSQHFSQPSAVPLPALMQESLPQADWQASAALNGMTHQFQNMHIPNGHAQPKKTHRKSSSPSKPATYLPNGKSTARSTPRTSQDSNSAPSQDKERSKGGVYALDVECVATGMTCQDRAVAQIAVVDENERLVLNLYVKPAQPVTSYLTALTGLTRELLDKEGVSLAEAMEIFNYSIPADAILLSYNIDTDLAWLQMKHKIGRGEVRDLKGCFQFDPDTQKYSRRVWGQDHLARVLLGISSEQHDAAGDAFKSMKLWRLYNSLREDPEKHRKALDLVDQTTKDPSFSMRNPKYEGVCMGNKRYCCCWGPPSSSRGPQHYSGPAFYGQKTPSPQAQIQILQRTPASAQAPTNNSSKPEQSQNPPAASERSRSPAELIGASTKKQSASQTPNKKQ